MTAGRQMCELVSESDLAAMRDAQFVDAALSRVQAAAAERQSTPGVCSNCGEPTAGGQIYCDADCRGDHESRQAIQRRKARA